MQVDDRTVMTGIFKIPVQGTVKVRALNLDGDGQADLTVHGGPDKAVYLYPSEHYPFWKNALRRELDWGSLGENLSVEGLTEDTVSIGDQFGIGTTILEVTQPRLPCFKFAGKFQSQEVVKLMLDSRLTGFYVRVLKEGSLQAGESISILHRDSTHLTIRELTDLHLNKEPKRSQIERALSVQTLARSWRDRLTRMLNSCEN
jgi:MOSC domain-containing protein YiiM